MQRLNKKKALVVSIFVVLSVGGAILYKYVQKNKAIEAENQKVNTLVKEGEGSTADSDNDGLKDWEETLWATSPIDNDSDNDGILDGVETKIGRNPNVPGPNDELASTTEELVSVDPYAFIASSVPKTATGNFIKDFARRYFAKGSTDGTISFQGVIDSDFAEQQFTAVDTEIRENIKEYTTKDITVLNQFQKKDEVNYLNRVSEILFTLPMTKEFVLLKDILAGTGSVSDFDSIYNGYQKGILEMLSLPTPAPLVETHLTIINNYSEIMTKTKEISQRLDDPLSLLTIVSDSSRVVELLEKKFAELYQYSKEKGILYSDKEGRYILP